MTSLANEYISYDWESAEAGYFFHVPIKRHLEKWLGQAESRDWGHVWVNTIVDG